MGMPELSDLHEECSGERCTILFLPKVCKGLSKADAKRRARIRGLMAKHAELKKDILINTQFKYEGRFKSGRKGVSQIGVYAFKAGQLRVYGGMVPKTPFFLCCEVDVKKQDEADQKLLNSTARAIASYVKLEA